MNSIEPPKRRDKKSSFKNLVNYVKNELKTGDDKWAINCHSVETAAIEMQSIADENVRCKDAVYHFILTWPEDEQPTTKQANEATETALKRLGFDIGPGGHQALGALHKDTSNYHLHIVVNKIHPCTLRSHRIEWSHTTINEACREIEYKQNWSVGKGLAEIRQDGAGNPIIQKSDYRNPDNLRLSSFIQDKEKHTGTISFARYVKEVVGPELKNVIKQDKTWRAAHQLLDKFNVSLIKNGGGFSIVDKETPKELYAAAGTMGNFAKAANLIKKLGDYQLNTIAFAPVSYKYNKNCDNGMQAVGKITKERSPNRKPRVKNKAAQ